MSEESEVGTEIEHNQDPRDYFTITSFQKRAAEIDPDKTHKWQTANLSVWIKGDYGTIAAGGTYDNDIKDQSMKGGMLIAENSVEGGATSVFVPGVKREIEGGITGIISDIAPRLGDKDRHNFIKGIISQSKELASMDPVSLSKELSLYATSFIPDHLEAVPLTPDEIDNFQLQDSDVDTQRVAEFKDFLSLLSRKLPPDAFRERMEKIYEYFSYMDEPFGRNYNIIIPRCLEWVMEDRGDMPRNYDILKRPPTKNFPIEVTEPLGTIEELTDKLKNMTAKPTPDRIPQTNSVAEFVELDKIVGGNNMTNWTVSTSLSRGVPNIYKIAESMQTTGELWAEWDSIAGVEIDGEYYVTQDGRHRVAALKALGVKEIPMIVKYKE